MARAALQIGVREVAKLAQVAASTVSRLEAGEELKPRTVEAIRRAFEGEGIEFTNGDAPGVKLRSPQRKKPATRMWRKTLR
jgi:transcriptional regulator with XRE-family HTH domain